MIKNDKYINCPNIKLGHKLGHKLGQSKSIVFVLN